MAPQSNSADILALILRVFTNTFSVIDCQFNKCTFSELICLIKAEVIRWSENPALQSLPSLSACGPGETLTPHYMQKAQVEGVPGFADKVQ